MVSFDLKGKVGIISGASRGLGKDMARGLAEAGADLVIVARSFDKLTQVAEELRASTGRKIIPVKCDITSQDDVKNVIDTTLKEFGKIDILVNNAAVIDRASALDITPEALDRVLDANLKAPFFFSREVVKAYMKEHGGHIVNICSVSSYRASAASPSYPISKAAAEMMTRCQAAAWAQYGIFVNAIAPGQFRLGMGESSSAEWIELMSKKIPQRRLGYMDDLNGALVFLSSDACRYTQGQTIVCDGGLLLPLA